MEEIMKNIIDLFSDHLLITKKINIKKEISSYFKEQKCIFYITKGKYKNTICNRNIYKQELCKVHYKQSSEYKNKDRKPEDYNIYTIELKELHFQGNTILISNDNIVYEKFQKGYFPIGKYIPELKKIEKKLQ